GGGLGLPPTGGATTHKIAQGDMLGTIAKKYGVTVKAIEEANKGIDATRLKVGTTINIPAPTASHTTTSTTRPAATRPGRTTTAATHPGGGTTSGTASATPKPGSSYVVKKGDTLSTIARAAYGEKGSWKKIADANKTAVPNPNSVAIGTEIQIPQ
ncbi:MAG TPA: LysM peptidoglycan-binding domain-containing protein, partial [Phycisphaerae bacterium]|nr:LysM peptidoglycan-binding domain-containing protein [Phycisphaerae bacterium]